MVKNELKPDKNWQEHRVRVLGKAATYERAIEKEKVADIESDLNLTENEKKSIANASRLRKRVDYSGFVENDCKSDDDVNFKIIASVLERSRKSKFIKIETITTTPNVPEFPKLKGFSKDPLADFNLKEFSEEPISTLAQTVLSPMPFSQKHICDTNLKGFAQVPLIDTPHQCSMLSTNPLHFPVSDCKSKEIMDKTLVTLLIEMKTSIKELQRQSEFNTQLHQALLENKNEYDDSMIDLDAFDSLIKRDNSVFTKLVIALASKGGQTLREIVKRAINALLTNDLQRKFNWTGTVGQAGDGENVFTKRAFRKLNCCLALQRGISKNPPTRSITESEFQIEVVRFLRGAADRNGGRKMRAVNSV